jgi:IclR family transcriptional regulator, acetate operon repressor
MASVLERSLIVLETLANYPEGCALTALAEAANMPASAAHRLLAELSRYGYIRQERDHGRYRLTMKLTALGLNFLNRSGIVDIVQPCLERLAEACGELVRLAVVDGDELIFVAKAQGSKSALRYDPDMGLSVPLSCSAAGHAWLSTMPESEALERVARQGFGRPETHGPRAPTSVVALLPFIAKARARGFSLIVEVFAPGMSAMSAPVRTRAGNVLGVVTIAGPMSRLQEERMLRIGPSLMATAAEIAEASGASSLFRVRAA